MATLTEPRPRKPVDPSTIKTEYSGFIQTYPRADDPDYRGCSCSAYGNTIPELMADVFRTATFYVANGYRVALERLTLNCAACHGVGSLCYSPRKPRKPCKACRGKGELIEFDPIALKPSDSVTIKHA